MNYDNGILSTCLATERRSKRKGWPTRLQDGSGTGYSYSFDAENNLVKATGMSGGPYCYVCDANGFRVAKKAGANSDCTGGTVTKLYWRSLSGDALAETDGSGSTTNAAYTEYVFFAGRRIASRVGPSNGSSAIFYYFADQLGSTRTVTTGSGSGQTPGQLCYDADFTPYGQEISYTARLQTTACPPNYKFTGYERDPETGLDYAFARYYSSRLGRFLSTDPLGGSVGDLQSHNAYAYVGNNPLNSVDPSGMWNIPGYRGGDDGGGGGGIGPRDELGIILCGPPGSGLPCSLDYLSCVGPTVPIVPPGIGGGGGGGGPSGPTPISEPPINVGSPIDDPGFGSGPIWSERIPIGVGPINPYLIIQNLLSGTTPVWSDAYGGWVFRITVWGLPWPGAGGGGRTPWYKNSCITGAIGNGLLHVGIDAIGLIPEGGVVAKAVGKVVFYGGYRGAVAAQQAAKVIGGVKMGTGISSTGLGSDDTSQLGLGQTGLGVAGIVSTLAGATPIVGQVFSGLSIVGDFVQMGMNIAKCK